MVSATRQHTGQGEIVPRKFELFVARREFFHVLWEMVPESRIESNSPYFAQGALIPPGDDEEALRDLLRKWQVAFHLTDQWVHDELFNGAMADLTEGRWYWYAKKTGQVRFPMRTERLPRKIPDCRNGYEVRLFNLHEVIELEDGRITVEDVGDIGHFDPRLETEDKAVARIMPELERRLRRALRLITEDDEAMGETVRSRVLPQTRHFEWAVRYQVLGESFGKIAASSDVREARSVSNAVRAVAGLIELTLREPDKGGRPCKQLHAKRARCITI